MNLLKVCFLVLFSAFAFTQSGYTQPEPVKWSIDKVENDGVTDVIITAQIDEKWKIYSNQTEEGGPIATQITFESDAKLLGEYKEDNSPVTYQSDLFDMQVSTFSETATFSQTLGDYNPGTLLTATVRFMCCTGSQCLPPTEVILDLTL